MKNSTGEDQREGVRVTSTHEQDLPGSRGVANFALKWVGIGACWLSAGHHVALDSAGFTETALLCRWVKDAKSAASLSVVSVKKVTRDYTGNVDSVYLPAAV